MAQKQRVSAADLSASITDISERIQESIGDIDHLLKNYAMDPGPYAQLQYSVRTVVRAKQSLQAVTQLLQMGAKK